VSQAVTLTEQLRDAIKKALEAGKKRNFKESVEFITVFRELDLKSQDARMRETVFLPHEPRKQVKICVVAEGDLALQAKNAGAYKVIGKKDLDEMSANRKLAKKLARECDWVLVQTDLMPIAGRVLGPALGPRGKIPVPLPPRGDAGAIISRYKRAVLLRIKDQPQIQARIGTVDNSLDELVENAQAILQAIENKYKGLNVLEAVYVKKTMGPPVKVKLR